MYFPRALLAHCAMHIATIQEGEGALTSCTVIMGGHCLLRNKRRLRLQRNNGYKKTDVLNVNDCKKETRLMKSCFFV